MRVTVTKFTVENMRSTRERVLVLAEHVEIKAQNKAGKTTCADGWHWLVNNKVSDGRTQADLRPRQRIGETLGEPIRGVVMAAEATLVIESDNGLNGTFVLRKEEHEKAREVERGIEYSYQKKYSINGDYLKEKDFYRWLHEIADAEKLRMFTDVHYFLAREDAGGIHHTTRRRILKELAVGCGSPQGFSDVDAAIKGRTLKGYIDELKEAKKLIDKDIASIGPQMQAHQEYADYDCPDSEQALTRKRDTCVKAIAAIDEERKKTIATQSARQKLIQDKGKLAADQIRREATLKADTSGTDELRKEAQDLQAIDATKREQLSNCQLRVRQLTSALTITKAELTVMLQSRDAAAKRVQSASEEVDVVCPAGDDCPYAAQTKDGAEGRAKRLKAAEEAASFALRDVQQTENSIHVANKELRDAMIVEAEVKTALDLFQEEAGARLAEIDAEIEAAPGIDPGTDDIWLKIVADIEVLAKKIGDPVEDVLQEIEDRKAASVVLRDKYNSALHAYDTAMTAREHIERLKTEQQALAQKAVAIEGRLARAHDYSRAESELISASVNNKFKHIQFRLFKYHQNGEIVDCCDALINGVPYAEFSGGEKKLAEVETASVLGCHYGVVMPIFVDECGSLTMPIAVPNQTILLAAAKGVEDLEVRGVV